MIVEIHENDFSMHSSNPGLARTHVWQQWRNSPGLWGVDLNNLGVMNLFKIGYKLWKVDPPTHTLWDTCSAF